MSTSLTFAMQCAVVVICAGLAPFGVWALAQEIAQLIRHGLARPMSGLPPPDRDNEIWRRCGGPRQRDLARGIRCD